MPKDWIKLIKKSKYKEQLEQMIIDIAKNDLSRYDIKKLKNKQDTYRVRIGPLRCIFVETEYGNIIIEIIKRGDAYRGR